MYFSKIKKRDTMIYFIFLGKDLTLNSLLLNSLEDTCVKKIENNKNEKNIF